MALTEQTRIFLGIEDDGAIQFRRTRVLTDGADVFEKHVRMMLIPGQDVTALPARVRALCAFVWTPAVVAAYQAAHPPGMP